MQTAVQLRCKTLRGTPLKVAVQEAQREEKNRIKSHNISSVLPLSSKILLFLSYHTIHNKVRQAICQSVLLLNEFPKPLKAITNMSSISGGIYYSLFFLIPFTWDIHIPCMINLFFINFLFLKYSFYKTIFFNYKLNL